MRDGGRRGTWIAGTAGMLLAAGMPVATARALTFTVNSTADEVDASPGNAICATASGTCTLRAAIQEANVVLGSDIIMVPAGTFQLTLTGTGDNAGVTGDLDVQQEVDITGAGPDATVIDGLGADRVFHVIDGTRLGLSGLTIANGAAPGSGGGGIRHDGPDGMALADVRFSGNSASQGGAVYYTGDGLALTDCAFADNTAGAGGAVFQGGDGPLTILRSTFDANTAGGGSGGAVYYDGTAPVAITDSRFTDNSAGSGGAFRVSTDADLVLAGSLFESSFAGSGGGGVYEGAGDVGVSNCRFVDNVALYGGGGLLVASTGSVIVTASELTDNLGIGDGGGIYFTGGAGNLAMTGVTLVGNSAPNGSGGAIFTDTSGLVALTEVEVRDGFAASGGGGVHAIGHATTSVARSRFVGNRVAGGPGGGMLDQPLGDTAISDTTFADNRALNGPGGGLYRAGGGTAAVAGSTFVRNQATGGGGQGGGLFILGINPTVMHNCTLSGNIAGDAGGGIYPASPITIASTTFAGNRAIATGGAAIYGLPTVTLTASILASNGVGESCGGTLPFVSGNDNIDQDGSCGLAAVNDRVVDPQLGPLADNGGPTETHMPLAGSPAVDTATNSPCHAADQRGVGRPTDGNGDGSATCDTGAVEFLDECPADPAKVLAGVCGCGVPDADANANGAVDCLVNAELKARIARAMTLVGGLTGDKTPEQTAMKAELKAVPDDLVAYVTQHRGAIALVEPGANLGKLAKKTRRAVRATLSGKGRKLEKKKARAAAALAALDAAVAP